MHIELNRQEYEQQCKEREACVKDLRVLIVDDSEDSTLLMKTYLGRYKARLTTVNNGYDAIKFALTFNYDAILMDIRMPEIDGKEVCRQLRQQGYQRCIIAVTASCMKHEVEEIMKMGFNDCIVKPIDWGHMMRVLKKCQRYNNINH